MFIVSGHTQFPKACRILTVLALLFNMSECVPIGFCPLSECDCDGTHMDCSGNGWSSVALVIFSDVFPGSYTESYYNALETIDLEVNDIQILPDVRIVLEFIPKLSLILLSHNPSINCSHVADYRKHIQIESSQCPIWRDTHVSTLETLPYDGHGNPELVDTSTATITPTAPSSDFTKSLTWTVILLNCCFVGISGMVLGGIIMLFLPVAIRRLARFCKNGTKPDNIVGNKKISSRPYYIHTEAVFPSFASKPKNEKHIIRLDL